MAKVTVPKLAKPLPNPGYQLHPTQLDGPTRVQHVINALLEYNAGIIKHNPTGANAKFAKSTRLADRVTNDWQAFLGGYREGKFTFSEAT